MSTFFGRCSRLRKSSFREVRKWDEEVVEELTDVADQIGYEKYECESKKPERFIGTTMDVLKITFKTLADMMRFKAHVDDQYA